jgi:amino acid permease
LEIRFSSALLISKGVHSDEVADHRQSSWFQTACTLVADAVGVGVLGIPYTMKVLGWHAGLTAIVLIGFSNWWMAIVLYRVVLTDPDSAITYADVGGFVSPRWQRIVKYTSAGFLSALVVADFLTAAISLQAIIAGAGHSVCRVVCGVVIAGIMIPISQVQTLHGLFGAVIAGVVCIFVPLVVVLIKLGQSAANTPESEEVTHIYASSSTMVEIISSMFSIVFAYSIQILQVEFMSEMRRPEEYIKVINTTTPMMMAIYVTVGSLSYYWLGDDVTAPVTLNLPNDSTLSIVNAFLLVHVLVALAINSNVLNNAAAAYYISVTQPSGILSSELMDPELAEPHAPTKKGRPAMAWFGVTLLTLLFAFVVRESEGGGERARVCGQSEGERERARGRERERER